MSLWNTPASSSPELDRLESELKKISQADIRRSLWDLPAYRKQQQVCSHENIWVSGGSYLPKGQVIDPPPRNYLCYDCGLESDRP